MRDAAKARTLLEGGYLTDVDVVNGWCLPLRGNTPALPAGMGFGWHQNHIDHVMRSNWSEVPSSLEIEQKKTVLLSFPGAYTYGHWIVDICARLEVARKIVVDEDVQYLVPGPITSWMVPFFSSFGIKLDQCVPVGTNDKVHVERLIVPSMMRVNDYLPSWPYATSFASLRAYGRVLAAEVPAAQQRRRLWVKRTVTGPDRPDLDEIGLHGTIEQFGFEVITPGSLSVAEQASAFGEAEIVVGEDSSSLHNIVWGKPKSLLVIGSYERINPLHMSICNIIGVCCRYLTVESCGKETYVIDKEKLNAILETMI